MSRLQFDTFFQSATGNSPYDYQCRLACGDAARLGNAETLITGRDCRSLLINVPTGLGKTAAVVLAWLWNRVELKKTDWPRRLVYCLPMRTLVEQTETEVKKWLTAHGQLWDGKLENRRGKIGVHILMGGEDASGWDIYPEENAILIGTQDMLLSRALNRGYAAGRARWPKDFALLNNDCLWVFDEVQLMNTGFATSLQLQAWRQRMQPAEPVHSWWMSATVEKDWLATSVDFREHVERIWNESEDQTDKLWNEDSEVTTPAAKTLKSLLQPGRKTFHFDKAPELKADNDPGKLAKYIADVSAKVTEQMKKPNARVLVILNTVARACDLDAKLRLDKHKPLLLHSRFRHREREAWQDKLKAEPLIIATQVVEAGVDISATVLFTELCPWPSFIQRCGRAARYPGEMAEVFWLDVSKTPLPYHEGELEATKEQLENLKDVSLASFRKHREALQSDEVRRLLPYDPRFVPQSKDLLELFDTTPDLTGADIDISRYIRDGEEHDISVFWRDCTNIKPGKNPPKAKVWQPEHAELCPVPVGGFYEFAKHPNGRVWRWDYREGWTRLNAGDSERIFPGQVFLLEKSCGGYDPEKGWTGNADDLDFEIGPFKRSAPDETKEVLSDENAQGSEDNIESSDGGSNTGQSGQWRSILIHSREVCAELAKLLGQFPKFSVGEVAPVLALAARLHDWGKAHAAFKAKVERAELEKAKADVPDGLPAKAPNKCWRRGKLKRQPTETADADRDYRRPGFRHELASALAILELLRRYQPNHDSLAWPDDAELRAAFPKSESSLDQPLPASAKQLAEEIAALSPGQFNLLLYLVAAHHGKVRLSLRSSPDDQREDVPQPCPADKRQARGVRDDDELPLVALPGEKFEVDVVHAPPITLWLHAMDLGLSHSYGPSWRERMGSLLQQHQPFRLAWYEAILRVADQRASKLAEDATSHT